MWKTGEFVVMSAEMTSRGLDHARREYDQVGKQAGHAPPLKKVSTSNKPKRGSTRVTDAVTSYRYLHISDARSWTRISRRGSERHAPAAACLPACLPTQTRLYHRKGEAGL